MLDIKRIRKEPDLVKAAVKNKNEKADIDQILALDADRRQIVGDVETLKAKRNKATAEIAQKKKAGEPAEEAIAAMRSLGQEISALDERRREVDEDLKQAMAWVPNIPHESVPTGPDESDNVVVREVGNIPEYDFELKPHWDIAANLKMLDSEAAARISGSGFLVLTGAGARLQRGLVNFMLDMHTGDGFTEAHIPHLVTADTMFGTGQLPKLDDDMYREPRDQLYLIPTSEVSLTNLYRDQIIDADSLPIRMVAHSPCYRREAGAAGKDTRGMLRVHQFDKVELVKIVHPDNSYDELESLVAQAEKVLQALKLPYRVIALATGDLTFASSKTYDIEVWAPGLKRYLEVSSISIFEDFQTRRMN
ncbi:MAG: serine--tRNA ligase, partial [candidate division Zixibacteria bacterium]